MLVLMEAVMFVMLTQYLILAILVQMVIHIDLDILLEIMLVIGLAGFTEEQQLLI